MLPTVILPGYLESASVYLPLAQTLIDRGSPTTVVPIKFWDWVPTIGGRSMVPILRLLQQTVTKSLTENQVPQINLIGHSAGGWISRIFIGAKPYDIHNDATEADGLWNNRGSIATLICLGTPQVSGERWTKKNLNFVNDNYPGAFYPEVDYTCVAGKSLYGESRWGLAYQSYQITCGNGQTWGDGITPIEAAHLAGARNLIIEGVKHSPRSSMAQAKLSKDPWYGSPDALEQWVGYLK
jgi:triacylglycerol esterase/lipase EstA (alpha/beta hydrolase family)